MVKHKQLIYISHPYEAKDENKKEVEYLIEKMYNSDKLFETYCILSPIHCFGFMYESVEYYKGLQFCLDLLIKCDIMLVFGNYEKSKGCTAEIELCKNLNIPYIIFDSIHEFTELSDIELNKMIQSKMNKNMEEL